MKEKVPLLGQHYYVSVMVTVLTVLFGIVTFFVRDIYVDYKDERKAAIEFMSTQGAINMEFRTRIGIHEGEIVQLKTAVFKPRE